MKRHSPEEAKAKILRYCVYQERSHKEVKNKLYELGLYSTEVDELISYLITEGFLSEERYAKAYAGGKFRMKKWGRLKITRELENHGLTTNCIKIGLREIDSSDYERTLQEVVVKKSLQILEENRFVKRDKIARYAIQRGFEPELVWKEVKRILPE
jgi:regulatory protein